MFNSCFAVERVIVLLYHLVQDKNYMNFYITVYKCLFAVLILNTSSLSIQKYNINFKKHFIQFVVNRIDDFT